MKRGFLNSKKAKDKLLSDDGASKSFPAVITPPEQLPPLGNPSTVVNSAPKKPEPVGYDLIESIPGTLPPHAVVRIPSHMLTKSREPSSICILKTSTCRSIKNTRGYYTPLPPQNPTDVVSIKNTPDMGFGLFAKRNFKINDVILSERPLLVSPTFIPFSSISNSLFEAEAKKDHDLLTEKASQQALRAMTKEDSDAFMGLANFQPNRPQALGIINTNSFYVDIDEGNSLEGQSDYSGVGKFTSRINHSCSPNVGVDFDVPTFAFQIIARRDIKAGQQLFYCYRGLRRSVKERRRQLLEAYGFVCQCNACVNATPESDKLREEMHEKILKISDGKAEMLANPQFNIRSLDPLLKMEQDLVKEGLDFGDYFAMLLFMIMLAYQKLNNMPKQREYMARSAHWFMTGMKT